MSKSFANTTAANTSQNRINKGVPGGGRFTFDTKQEAFAVTLEAPAADTAEDMTAKLSELISPEKLLDIAKSSAAHYHKVYRVRSGGQHKSNTHDVDDTAQDAIVAVLEAIQRGNKITNAPQMVASVAANMTVRATANVFRAEDRRAYRQYTSLVETKEMELGRQLSQREKDEAAQFVLDNWHDPRHKPSKDFRTPITVDLSLDKNLNDENGNELTLGSALVAPENSGHYIEPGSFMDRAFTHAETKGAAHKAEAKRLAYNAFAERAESPLALAGTMSQRQVTSHRKVMADSDGGVLGACKDWSNDVETPAVTALLAPFGDLSVTDQDKVVTLFEHFGEDKAQVMWESAIAFANNKHSAGQEAA